MNTLRTEKRLKFLTASADNEIRLAQRNIGYNVREWTVEVIIQKYGDNIENDKTTFYSDYQRDYKWDTKTASRFIESILLDFPIPLHC